MGGYSIHHDFVKVLDFGLVALAPDGAIDDNKLTAEHSWAGTPAFLAPEIATGDDEVDGRADLYALGCVAYWLLTGRVVFEKNSPMATVIAHVTETPTPPSQYTTLPIPLALDALILQCLAKSPGERPESAAAFAYQLTHIPLAKAWSQDDARGWWLACSPFPGVTDSPSPDDPPPLVLTTAYGQSSG